MAGTGTSTGGGGGGGPLCPYHKRFRSWELKNTTQHNLRIPNVLGILLNIIVGEVMCTPIVEVIALGGEINLVAMKGPATIIRSYKHTKTIAYGTNFG